MKAVLKWRQIRVEPAENEKRNRRNHADQGGEWMPSITRSGFLDVGIASPIGRKNHNTIAWRCDLFWHDLRAGLEGRLRLLMDNPNRHSRLSPPLMHVFRAAHEAKDAKRIIDQRNEAGERVIAGRRLRVRQIITESMLRREVSRDLTRS